jgi:hypothetical protein
MDKKKFVSAVIFWEKIFIFLLALALVGYFSIAFMQWGDVFKELFLFKGDIESYIYLTVFLLIISFVLRSLLIWMWRLEFKEEYKAARRRRRR